MRLNSRVNAYTMLETHRVLDAERGGGDGDADVLSRALERLLEGDVPIVERATFGEVRVVPAVHLSGSVGRSGGSVWFDGKDRIMPYWIAYMRPGKYVRT